MLGLFCHIGDSSAAGKLLRSKGLLEFLAVYVLLVPCTNLLFHGPFGIFWRIHPRRGLVRRILRFIQVPNILLTRIFVHGPRPQMCLIFIFPTAKGSMISSSSSVSGSSSSLLWEGSSLSFFENLLPSILSELGNQPSRIPSKLFFFESGFSRRLSLQLLSFFCVGGGARESLLSISRVFLSISFLKR